MDLPIFQYKQELIDAVENYQCLIVVGDTGSGKTTQLPQYLNYKMVVSQPRRIAAISAAERVCDEMGCSIGSVVGYSVGFDNQTSSNTRITFMTDGILLKYSQENPLFTDYELVILDEAHERSLDTDILLALLRNALNQRPELKLIVMSATINLEKFSDYFNCFSVPGGCFEVDILWHAKMNLSTLKSTYLQRAVDTIIEIDKTEPQGDILVFLTGKNEVETCIRLLKEKLKSNSILCVPLYSSIGPAEQKTIFQPSVGVRKVVVATNIAQTSLTVPGIKFVVDSGFEKQKMYDPKTHMDGLVVTLISKAAANQRAGRAGRTEEGRVYRLYSKNIFEEMRDTTIPEIQRSSLLSTVLYLKRIGVQDVLSFPFIEPPNQDALVIALKQLYMIGALDDFGALTDMGKLISEFPISPFLARSLIAASNDFHCSSEVLTIVSMLSVENVFISTKGSTDISPQSKFFDKTGDHLTLLYIYNQWREKGSTDWCSHYRLNYKAIRAADNMRTQLKELMRKLNLVISFSNDRKAILSSICTGFYINTAKKHSQRSFYFPYWNSINGQSSSDMIALFISPQSALYEASDELKWVIYNNVEFVNQAGMKTVSKIDFAMVKDLFKDFGNVDMYKLTGLDIYRREIKLDSQIAQEPVAQIRPNIANDDIAKRVSEARERYEARKRLKK